MAKQYKQLDSGLCVPSWMPDIRDRRRIRSARDFRFTPGAGCNGAGCGCDSCEVFKDDFTTDDLEDKWTAVSGSWSIADGVLSTSSSNAVLICSRDFQDAPTFHNHVIQVKLKASTGDKSRIVFNYNSSSGAYHFVEVEWADEISYVYIKASSGSTIATSDNLTFTNGEWYDFKVCVSDTTTLVNWSNPTLANLYGTIAATRTACGVGTGTTSAGVQFDDFSLNQSGFEKSGCPTCSGLCNGCNMHEYYLVDLGSGGWTNGRCTNCASVSGQYIVGNTSACAWWFHKKEWDSNTAWCTTFIQAFSDSYQWWVYVIQSGPNAYTACNTYYRSSQFATACSDALVNQKVTLTRYYQFTGTDTACAASLPTTITIEPAPV